jgi:hypothetical protein
MTTAKAIRQAIEALPKGTAFQSKDLLQFGTRAAVDQVLHRMNKKNKILRIAPGIYARPKWSKYVKTPVMPEPYTLAAIANRFAATSFWSRVSPKYCYTRS